MPKLTIDGMEVDVEPGTSVLQACEQLGVEVPRFCYHDKLSVPANCRMCLVEMERAPKPVASCAMPCADGMVVHTQSEKAKKARQGVMEFLLINHPLDCPICDQGGECDLQDQAMEYGYDRGRYDEPKRAVKDKELGPLIKTIMTRCIHCTRCVRFADEIAGVPDLGGIGRGEEMEISNYISGAIGSELSGNLIDICPVGALTSKPYEFQARPWELKKTETIDVMDAVGSNIRVDVRGRGVMRVLPRLHEGVNEEWISDKTRFACDGLSRQRLDKPYVREGGKLRPASWSEAFDKIKEALGPLKGSQMAAISGDLCDAGSIKALKDMMGELFCHNLECRQDGSVFDPAEPAGYLFNTTIAGIEQADALVLIGCNPRAEAPIINARIRKTWLAHDLPIAMIGSDADLTYPVMHLGDGPDALQDLIKGEGAFVDTLTTAKNPMLIIGQGALRREDGQAVQAAAYKLADTYNMVRDDWCGYNMLHTAAARAGALLMGFVPGEKGRDLPEIFEGCEKGDIKAVYLLGADELPMQRLGQAFVIYQGHHGDAGAHRADVILPGVAYTEKDGIYVNTEGRAQMARRATFPLGEAREDWKIIRALAEELGCRLPYDTISQLHGALIEEDIRFGQYDEVIAPEWKRFGAGRMKKQGFVPAVDNFYMTNPICRASETMAACVREILHEQGQEEEKVA